MMKTKVFLSACVILAAAAAAGFGLETTQGNVRLVLHEASGRFNVHIGAADGATKPYSFFVKEDPRTTLLQLLVDNNIYTMGEAAGFKPAAEKTATGARFTWSSPILRVTEEFIFLTPADSPLSEGVKIIVKIENVSEVDRTVAARYLFDTYLGEKSGTHFISSSGGMIAREAVSKKAGEGAGEGAYWISPLLESREGAGLLVLADAVKVTPPEAVVFANWKRLYDARWEYKTMPNLDFNYYPYSFNDSAVCHYYPALRLPKKSGREIVLILGNSASYLVPKSTITAKNTTEAASDKNKLLDLTQPPVLEDTTEVAKADVDAERKGPPEVDLEKMEPILPPSLFTGSVSKPLTQANRAQVLAEIGRLDQFVEEINAAMKEKQLANDATKKFRATLVDIESRAMQK